MTEQEPKYIKVTKGIELSEEHYNILCSVMLNTEYCEQTEFMYEAQKEFTKDYKSTSGDAYERNLVFIPMSPERAEEWEKLHE